MSSKKPISTAPVYQLKVTLKGSSPRIWRRILVGGDPSLAKLHRILQAAMGWSDSHLHLFKIHGGEYGTPDEQRELDFADERKVKLTDLLGPKDRFIYEYDFGDCWLHEILVEKIVPREEGTRYPLCVAGPQPGASGSYCPHSPRGERRQGALVRPVSQNGVVAAGEDCRISDSEHKKRTG
jgi:hypothetical protein